MKMQASTARQSEWQVREKETNLTKDFKPKVHEGTCVCTWSRPCLDSMCLARCCRQNLQVYSPERYGSSREAEAFKN